LLFMWPNGLSDVNNFQPASEAKKRRHCRELSLMEEERESKPGVSHGER